MTWARALGSLLTRPARPPIDAFERSLIDAVIASPDDDAPRLVYADWLCAQAEPILAARGELIVVQCALEAMADPAEHNRLKARDFDLIDKHGSTWCAHVGLGEVRNNFYESHVEANFRRGFIDSVITPLASFVAVAVPLFTNETPQHLTLFGTASDVIARLGSSIFLRRLRSLTLRKNWALFGQLHSIVNGANVGNIERLEIVDSQLELADIEALARSATLRSVRELVLHRNRLAPDCIAPLVESALASRLEVLELDDNQIGDAGLLALVEAPALVRLRRLSLADIEISRPMRAQLRARFGDALAD